MADAQAGNANTQKPEPLETLIPARLDRLPWSRFHWLIVFALGITWILDGLEVTLKGAISGVLQEPETLNFTSAQIGAIASFYLAGCVAGAIFFGYLTDRFGRKVLFFVTLTLYLVGVLLTAFSWNWWSFALFRFMTGAGIGGEYAAINSAIDELIPARVRGRIDLFINGSYWLGAAVGSLSTLVLLNPDILPTDIGWRVGFGIGAILGLCILLVRRYVPESPRWLATHGYEDQAEKVVKGIENEIEKETGKKLDQPSKDEAITIHPRRVFGFGIIFKTMFKTYPKRSVLGMSLMVSQAFLYNAIFFTYALVLTRFYDVPSSDTGMYLLPFAIGNFLGVLVLGSLFDTIGRRQMISATYGIAATLLVVTGILFVQDALTAVTQTAMWTVIFFFASPAASSAYLTVSEVFPLEMRAMAISLFYAIGTATGGVLAPWIFGSLIGTGNPMDVFYGYCFAAALLFVAAGIAIVFGVKAEQRGLEEVAEPLSAQA
ncbi:MFS transporter [Afifella marina]|uniref:Predicted arabinose efflux permease, MFS family n=1 Tax=Afifella marina DSM 2698 TaxID=1120955 RepID=A0A1G5MK21_AFIMA|nr:MFS transporter [Afifella marina]MBK1623764.1 MFS transporter [Afifella marina DSM 2698]MBK1627320.1 MFS transporter [Afifella marina]MBK5918651.1 MFS transporter [Afifella marina]RAI22727.1 MFS transporter [Afifella marina DSM 2698]SCZ24918.1 Predicted arabinose efflux permease, MFS family [Afifella marina DSM 2698]